MPHLPRQRLRFTLAGAFGDFSGGVNLRDTASELALNEFELGWNVTLDERGGVGARMGQAKYNGTPFAASKITNFFHWQSSGGHTYTQAGTSLYQDASTTPLLTFSTAARCAMVEFAGKLCIIHPADGFFTYTYGGLVVAVATGPIGDSMAVWQNKIWTNDNVNLTRVHFCAAGDPSTWPADGFNDIRDLNDTAVVRVGGSGDSDLRPGLDIFKSESTHRIYDSATGAYQTIDPSNGAAGALSVTNVDGIMYVVNERGIFESNGTTPLRKVSGKLDPLFEPSAFDYTNRAKAVAGEFRGRAYFTIPTSSGGFVAIEYNPALGAFTLGSNVASVYCRIKPPAAANDVLVVGSPTVNGQLYTQFQGGTDDGASINAYTQTRWLKLGDGLRARLNRARVNARGSFTVYPLYSYNLTQSPTRSIAVTSSSSVYSANTDLFNLGAATAFSFRCEATTSGTATIPAIPGGSARTVGAWALYGIDLTGTPLGRS